MLPTGDVGDWCAEIHQVWRSLALQTTVDSHAELEVDSLRHIQPVQFVIQTTEWPKKVRTPSVLFIHNHTLLKGALKEYRNVVQGFKQLNKHVHYDVGLQV